VLILILPGPCGAVGPGQVWGRIPGNPAIDDWYETNPQDNTRGMWSTVYTFNDEDKTNWTTAVTILDLNFRDFSQFVDYHYYVDYMTVPWIAITWDNLTRQIYRFVDSTGSPSYKFQYNDYDYNEGNDGANPDRDVFTTVNANYNLDHDGDNGVDFNIEITYDLKVDANKMGSIIMHIRVVTHPDDGATHWAHNGDKVQYIEFPFLFNPKIAGFSNNDVQYKNSGVWYDVDTEAVVTTSTWGQTINVFKNGRQVLMDSNNCQQSNMFWYVLKHDSDGQFSQYPGAYLNNENTDNEDVDIWYIANYTRNALLAIDQQQPNNWEITASFHDFAG
jgi:hypothetical protein